MEVFQGAQAQKVIKYVRETYGGELEFLWRRFPENAIFRNAENRKWYAAMLRVEAEKLGITGAGKVEILDLRFEKNEALSFAESSAGILPGYHMNKNSWITVVLDRGVSDAKVFGLVDHSFELVRRGR